MRKLLKRWWKKLQVGLAASAKLEKNNPKMVAALTAAAALTASTAGAQTSYSTYNNTPNYYSGRETFQNQNTGGYTGSDQLRSDNWFIRSVISIFGGSWFSPKHDLYAPRDSSGSGGGQMAGRLP